MNQKTTIRGLTLQRASLAWVTRPWSRAVIDAAGHQLQAGHPTPGQG
jgi:hypothetical protein